MLQARSPINSLVALLLCVMQVSSTHQGGVMEAKSGSSRLQARAPGQSEQAVNGSRGNITIAIAAAVSIAGTILIFLIIVKYVRWRKQRQAAQYAAAHPEMAQAAALLVPSTTAATPGARRPRRPRRQPSTQTVPEYSEQAGDEEMVLDKAEEEADVHIENVPPTTSAAISTISTRNSGDQEVIGGDAHYAASVPYHAPSRPRTSYTASRTTLQDIENPAPELRMDRVDTVYTQQAPSLLSSSENGHQPLLTAGVNESSVTLDEVPLDGMPPGASRRSTSFFASPAYVNRSRSRSIDIVRTMSAAQEGAETGNDAPTTSHGRTASSGSTLAPPPESRRTSSFLSMFPRRQSNSTLLPLHQPLPDSRREALRNREISAPISETLVKTSYTYPKAGINPIQAAWLGSRDHITRLTTYLDTAPPAFEEEADSLEMDRRTSRDTLGPLQSFGQSSSNDATASDESARQAVRSSSSNAFAELEEESAQLSSLVHQESLRRSSLPPHMVALPPSLPVSPISPRTPGSGIGGGNADWPISRAASLARAHSLLRHRLSSDQNGPLGRQNSIARRRVQSDAQGLPSSETSSSLASSLPRSESPTPLPRGNALQNGEAGSNARPVLSLTTGFAATAPVTTA